MPVQINIRWFCDQEVLIHSQREHMVGHLRKRCLLWAKEKGRLLQAALGSSLSCLCQGLLNQSTSRT